MFKEEFPFEKNIFCFVRFYYINIFFIEVGAVLVGLPLEDVLAFPSEEVLPSLAVSCPLEEARPSLVRPLEEVLPSLVVRPLVVRPLVVRP